MCACLRLNSRFWMSTSVPSLGIESHFINFLLQPLYSDCSVIFKCYIQNTITRHRKNISTGFTIPLLQHLSFLIRTSGVLSLLIPLLDRGGRQLLSCPCAMYQTSAVLGALYATFKLIRSLKSFEHLKRRQHLRLHDIGVYQLP